MAVTSKDIERAPSKYLKAISLSEVSLVLGYIRQKAVRSFDSDIPASLIDRIMMYSSRHLQEYQIDMNLADFERRFIEQQPNIRCDTLPPNRHRSEDIRSSIGSPRSELIIYFVWNILCKYDAAIKLTIDDDICQIPDDDGVGVGVAHTAKEVLCLQMNPAAEK